MTSKADSNSKTSTQKAEIVREYGPFEGAQFIAGVTYDGK